MKSTSRERWNKIRHMAVAIVAVASLGLAGFAGSVAVANASPVTKVGSDPVAPVSPGGNNHKAPFTKVGSDPVSSIVTGVADAAAGGADAVPDVPIKSPWPGGAWADHDWRDGYPGGAWAGHDWVKDGYPGGAFANKNDGKGGGGYLNGKAGGAWNHR